MSREHDLLLKLDAFGVSEGQKERLLKEYAKESIKNFGDWNLSRDMKYERGQYPEWGELSYSQKVDKYFEFINQ